jgi:hypothetical protein
LGLAYREWNDKLEMAERKMGNARFGHFYNISTFF